MPLYQYYNINCHILMKHLGYQPHSLSIIKSAQYIGHIISNELGRHCLTWDTCKDIDLICLLILYLSVR